MMGKEIFRGWTFCWCGHECRWFSSSRYEVDTADYDNDGDIDLIVTNYQLENNALYRNEGSVFSEVSFSAGIGES